MSEEWRPIAGFEGRYEVSSLGRVRSVSRVVKSINRWGQAWERVLPGKVLAMHPRGYGYWTISLLSEKGESHGFMVHRLVAEAFIPNPFDLPEVNHIDADVKNARVENLEWVDKSMNAKHAYKIGRRETGSSHHFSNLQRDASGRVVADGEVPAKPQQMFNHEGRAMSLAEWSKELGIKYTTLYQRIVGRGWSVERAFTTTASPSK